MAGRRGGYGKGPVRAAAVVLAAILMFAGHAVPASAEVQQSGLIEAAFEMLEEGNPFVRRYGEITGQKVEPLFPRGVPYFFGGLTGAKGSGWFYLAYPDYHVHQCEKGSNYFRKGKFYFYGVDCSGFVRHVYRACGKQDLPPLSTVMLSWDQREYHLYDYREGFEAPPYGELKDTLQVGDLLLVKHEDTGYRHVMMYIGTLRDFGYTAEEEPALADWLDYPLVIHCGGNPFYGERFQELIDSYPEKYGKCTTTDGGVAVSILGPEPADAPEHGNAQGTDYSWFTMNDRGYGLTVISTADVKYYCWYRR